MVFINQRLNHVLCFHQVYTIIQMWLKENTKKSLNLLNKNLYLFIFHEERILYLPRVKGCVLAEKKITEEMLIFHLAPTQLCHLPCLYCRTLFLSNHPLYLILTFPFFSWEKNIFNVTFLARINSTCRL